MGVRVYIIAGLVLAAIAFIAWRWTSVGRGARQRDRKLLDLLEPVGMRLHNGEPVAPRDILELARKPQLRHMIYATLDHFQRPELFPAEYLERTAQAESGLAYWLMHPNEMQDAPEELKLVERISREIHGMPCEVFVFRFKMPAGHWAAQDGWLLGLAGPIFADTDTYCRSIAGFSRCGDKHGEVEPAELVDWYLGLAQSKGAFATREEMSRS